MDRMEQIDLVAEALTARFPEGHDPFRIMSRLAEECGEIAHDLNHYTRKGISVGKGSCEGKENLALECFQIMVVTWQLVRYFGLEEEFGNQADRMFDKLGEKGFIRQGNAK